ncbi:MAG: TIGR01777 family protein [Parachlamydiaceae bacterium]|nr:TIGR01777 family protein [Parachlamydiaceae bacterium]
MKVLVAGSSGLIGTALVAGLTKSGYEVLKLQHGKNWDSENKKLDPSIVEGVDLIINLAGENIFGRWSVAKKEKILKSRVNSTALLADTVVKLKVPPKLFINASAIGYYGNRGNEILSESSLQGNDFLSDVCHQWETALIPAKNAGIRTIMMRTGVVLSPNGGALKNMLLPFKLGLGGVIGSGSQYMSWIAIDDVVAALLHCVEHEECEGAINFVAPDPVTNAKFTAMLGDVLHRPTFMPQPVFLMRALFGEMVDALLLSSTRVEPQKLMRTGYQFLYPELKNALKHLL